MTRDDALAELRRITNGIDADEVDRSDGWWETTGGARFGAERLALLEGLVSRLVP